MFEWLRGGRVVGGAMESRKESFTYEAPTSIFALAWSNHKETANRIAFGSFVEDYTK